MIKSSFGVALLVGLLGCPVALAAETINLADVAELSGSGATVGTNFKNGVDLAVEEINAQGGILGAKIVVTHVDTQSNAGDRQSGRRKRRWTASLMRCSAPAIPARSRSCAPLAAEAGVAEIMGGEAADLTRAGNKFLFRTSFGQQSSMPKIAKYIAEDAQGEDCGGRLCQQRFRQGRPRRDPEGVRRARHQGRRSTIRPKRARPTSPPTR